MCLEISHLERGKLISLSVLIETFSGVARHGMLGEVLVLPSCYGCSHHRAKNNIY